MTEQQTRPQRLHEDLAFWERAIERAEAEYRTRLKLAAVAATHGDAEDRETAITAAGDSRYEVKRHRLRLDEAALRLRQLEASAAERKPSNE